MSKTILYIAILVNLFSFSFNLIVKCDGQGIVKMECHSDDCNESKESNVDCSHCLIINNTILISPLPIVFNSESEIFYFSDISNYKFHNTNSQFRPPQV